MCFGAKKAAEQAAAEARRTSADLKRQEAQRQANIKGGRTKIETAFSRFNDDYFGNYTDQYLDYYNPQIDEQYTTATGKAAASFRDRGMGQSTVAAGGLANLFKDRSRARTQVANDAASAANQLRGNVENTKTNLYNLNQSAADPESANIRAQAEATALVAPPTYSPLGQVFAASLNSIGNAGSAYQNRAPAPYRSPYSTAAGGGSSQVIR